MVAGSFCESYDATRYSPSIDLLSGVCSGVSFVCNSTCIDPAAPPLDLCNGWDDDCNNATLDGAGEPWFHTLCDGVDADLCDEGESELVGE